MKNAILTVLAFLLFMSASAQRVNVTTGMEKLNDEFQPTYKVFIPHATAKSVSREWSDFLKDQRAKVKSSGNEMNADNVVLRMISRDTMQVFSRVEEAADGVLLIVGFELANGFMAETTHPSESQAITKMLNDLAIPIAKKGLDEKISIAEKAYANKVKESESLAKKNEKLRSDNEKMQLQIHENEREIKDNEQKANTLKTEIGDGKQSLDAINEKKKDLN